MRPSCFITTPIYYVNDVPHIGHAYTTIAADTLARYKRMTGHDVLLLTGTDEHGQKIQKAAEARGITPLQLADRLSEGFREVWKTLGIAHDDFIRTTEERHRTAVYAVYERMRAAGDVFLGEYEGSYCVPCESFWTGLQLVNGNCPDCGRAVETVTESSWFFRLSAYGDRLLAHIEAHPDFISPPSRRNEVVQFIRMGLRDLSISRTGVKWGIPLPDAPGHTIYVWLDALVNYLTASGFPNPGYEKRWPAQTHIIGKDILRFHAVYWPAFLMSAGLPLPERIVSHGWWTIQGEKMSKSKGNVIDPVAVAEHFGTDALRYFLLREVPFGNDGDFSVTRLTECYNAELANGIGNLLSRTVSMVHKYRGGTVPATGGDDPAAVEMAQGAAGLPVVFLRALDDPGRSGRGLLFDEPLQAIRALVWAANTYIHDAAPWDLHKQGNDARLDTVLYNAVESLRIAATFLYPFMPESAGRIWHALGLRVDPHHMDFAGAARWGGYPPGTTLPPVVPLFPRKDPESLPARLTIAAPAQELSVDKNEPGTPAPQSSHGAPASPATDDGFASIADFSRLRIQAGVVKEAERVRKSEKLLKLQVDIGTEVRQIVAGIGRKFTPEEMVGRQVVVLTNLRPAVLMGVESQGMLLAAGADEVEALLTTSAPVTTGARIR
ncbi:MAG: methionine--tRNA ligase [Nitrospirota bacterium]|nr:methionine--tRNA ligase [Nitrospirota bacterium]